MTWNPSAPFLIQTHSAAVLLLSREGPQQKTENKTAMVVLRLVSSTACSKTLSAAVLPKVGLVGLRIAVTLDHY